MWEKESNLKPADNWDQNKMISSYFFPASPFLTTRGFSSLSLGWGTFGSAIAIFPIAVSTDPTAAAGSFRALKQKHRLVHSSEISKVQTIKNRNTEKTTNIERPLARARRLARPAPKVGGATAGSTWDWVSANLANNEALPRPPTRAWKWNKSNYTVQIQKKLAYDTKASSYRRNRWRSFYLRAFARLLLLLFQSLQEGKTSPPSACHFLLPSCKGAKETNGSKFVRSKPVGAAHLQGHFVQII